MAEYTLSITIDDEAFNNEVADALRLASKNVAQWLRSREMSMEVDEQREFEPGATFFRVE